jgi:GH15 family glucan-1,4-alpha-glucosidase
MKPAEPIENHAVVGDLHTVALVALDGSIDFMCFPRFDSPSVFAALLDPERGGRFSIAPELDGARRKQLYLPDSNILLTRFLSTNGVAEISDFMPVDEAAVSHNLVRRVKSVRGEVRVRMVCAPRFNYARSTHRVERSSEKEVVFTSEGEDGCALRLRSSVPLSIENGDAVAAFTLRADEAASFVLEDARENLPCNADRYVADSFKGTLNYCRNWIGHCRYQGRWRETVNRSALTLKLLVSQPFGSLVAAPTFGLPEIIGGGRNWDYRYTWIRDASFTIYALMRLGYTQEAGAFNHWIEQRCHELNPDGSLQIMYGIDGRHDLTEESLLNLRGHRGSQPVRIGNGAWNQLQLDIHGELMDSVYLYDKWGEPISHDLWQNLVRLIDWVCKNWQQPEEGIWEVRGGRKEFLYSRLMCWVAIDRGVRLARKRSFPAPLSEWTKIRDAIYDEIFAEFWCGGERDLRAAQRLHHRRCRLPAHAAGEVYFTDRPPLALYAARHRTRVGGRLTCSPLSHRRRCARWLSRRGGDIQHVHLWVCRVPRSRGRSASGPVHLRKDARLRQSRRPLRRRARPRGRTSRQLPASLHPPRPHQRRLRPRPRPPGARIGCLLKLTPNRKRNYK